MFEWHSVLLFRGQTATDDLQLTFSRRFGPLEITKRASLGEGSHFSILTNLDPEGARGRIDFPHRGRPWPE